MIRKLATVASAAMMTVAPLAASAGTVAPINPAASLSLAPTSRAHTGHKHSSDLFGASALIVLVVAAAGVGIAAAATNGFSSSSN